MVWYEDEVRGLERDRLRGALGTRPPVFYGSSSIRLWDTLAEDVGPSVLNLGFGGSTLEACDFFFNRLIVHLKPRSLVLYAGDNDLGDNRSPDQVYGWFRSVAVKLAASVGGIPFGFISIKPSPARFGIVDRIRRTNSMVRQYIECLPNGYYVDVYDAMLTKSGAPRMELYTGDGLHLSRAGYLLWSEALKAHHHKIFTK